MYDNAGNLIQRYVHGPGVDEPLVGYDYNTQGALQAKRWYYANHQGSVIATADAAGDVEQIVTYSAFGIPGEQAPPLFGYTGQVWDEETQLAYYKARYYSPERGRFVSTDPAGYIDSMNLYGYVVNDPVNLVDPDGTFAIAGGVFGAFSGGIGGYIASGGNLNSAIKGALAGGVIGLINPFASYAAGSIAGAVAAGAAGQAIGLANTDQDIFKSENYDGGAILGSALVGTGGAKLGYHTATRNSFLAAKIGKSGSNVIRSAEAIYGGFGAGIGEIIGSNGKSLRQSSRTTQSSQPAQSTRPTK